jgi:hypothetical protein
LPESRTTDDASEEPPGVAERRPDGDNRLVANRRQRGWWQFPTLAALAATGSGLILLGVFLTDGGYAQAVVLQIGSACLLFVPLLLLEFRIERLRTEVSDAKASAAGACQVR